MALNVALPFSISGLEPAAHMAGASIAAATTRRRRNSGMDSGLRKGSRPASYDPSYETAGALNDYAPPGAGAGAPGAGVPDAPGPPGPAPGAAAGPGGLPLPQDGVVQTVTSWM